MGKEPTQYYDRNSFRGTFNDSFRYDGFSPRRLPQEDGIIVYDPEEARANQPRDREITVAEAGEDIRNNLRVRRNLSNQWLRTVGGKPKHMVLTQKVPEPYL